LSVSSAGTLVTRATLNAQAHIISESGFVKGWWVADGVCGSLQVSKDGILDGGRKGSLRVTFLLIGERDPSPLILAMNHEHCRTLLQPVNQQDQHLTGALIRSMVRAKAVVMSQSSISQVKRAIDSETGSGQ
jgi:hypothetical protein